MSTRNFNVAKWMPDQVATPGDGIVVRDTPTGDVPITTFAPVGGGGGGGGGTGNPVAVQVTAPRNPSDGDFWLDTSAPLKPELKIFTTTSGWVAMAPSDIIPRATKPNQFLHSGTPAGFPWEVEDTIDMGRY